MFVILHFLLNMIKILRHRGFDNNNEKEYNDNDDDDDDDDDDKGFSPEDGDAFSGENFIRRLEGWHKVQKLLAALKISTSFESCV